MISYKWLLLLGIIFLLWAFLAYKGIHPFAWFGKLPGDIHYTRNNFSVFIPIASTLLISLLLSLLGFLLRK